MNPSAPFSNPPSFSFLLPQNPNLPANSHPYYASSTFEHQTPLLPDLSSTLSSLDDLIILSNQTLLSLSNLKLLPTTNGGLIPCPFDPSHRLPPPSLFRHFLRCPSSSHPPRDADHLLQSLHYPRNVVASDQLLSENRFRHQLLESEGDLCFSVENNFDLGSNFFYLDCPGVVSTSKQDAMQHSFALPRILATGCENFSSSSDGEGKNLQHGYLKLLPSNLWALQSEVLVWNDYPYNYSYDVLCALVSSDKVRVQHLMDWVVENSPRYGIVIDLAMSDHIFLLFRLCLKAIRKEALSFLENGDRKEGGSMNFKCPNLVQALMWLVSHLSVLYGDSNGKYFAISMLRQFVIVSASGLACFPSEELGVSSSVSKEEFQNLDSKGRDVVDIKLGKSNEENKNEDSNNIMHENVTIGPIFVSQVAAAVAALHERYLLEEKIKALRLSQPLNRYQRMTEYEIISRRADEDRKKRPDYRPVIDHDGLPRHQSYNPEANKSKTREEILAEERDYKRRRMSYRGKKVKRTSLQVTRDIIEEYMDEIKQAGGIGCFVKETEDRLPFPTKPSNQGIMGIDEPKQANYDSARPVPNHSREHYTNNTSSAASKDASPHRDEHSRQHYDKSNDFVEEKRRNDSIGRHNREYHYRSSDRHSRSHKESGYHVKGDDVETRRSRHREINRQSGVSNYRESKSYSMSKYENGSRIRKEYYTNRWESNSDKNYDLDSRVRKDFGDRYDPSESLDD